VNADFNTADEYQASYLISQGSQRTVSCAELAVAKLCNALPAIAGGRRRTEVMERNPKCDTD
jgi:hypothetical protein